MTGIAVDRSVAVGGEVGQGEANTPETRIATFAARARMRLSRMRKAAMARLMSRRQRDLGNLPRIDAQLLQAAMASMERDHGA